MTYLCSRCQTEWPEEAFSPSQLKKRTRWCKTCHNERRRQVRSGEVVLRTARSCGVCGTDITHMRSHAKWCSTSCAAKGFRAEHPGYSRSSLLRNSYQMTTDDFDALLAAQGGTCAICQTVPDRWHVDHDHSTGAVRGILCHLCNQGIGQLRDDPAIVARALDYLRAHARAEALVVQTGCHRLS